MAEPIHAVRVRRLRRRRGGRVSVTGSSTGARSTSRGALRNSVTDLVSTRPAALILTLLWTRRIMSCSVTGLACKRCGRRHQMPTLA